jgi:DNA polymerase-4
MLDFNPSAPSVMHVDLNSCFASVEQQANPLYRGRPVAVGAYTSGAGCILAASREAKKMGITTGMRVGDGKRICPNLIVLPPDPAKYRAVNKALYNVLGSYTPDISIESIDEMVMKIPRGNMIDIAGEIKQRIKTEIGDWLTVSVGISTNRYLAKVASGLHKPDGLDMITKENIEEIFSALTLEDLCGIKEGNANRLRFAGIMTPKDLLTVGGDTLQRAFHSVVGHWWHLRLHGYEDGAMYKQFDAPENPQRTFGQSFAMGHPHTPAESESYQILSQLVVKMSRRMRAEGFTTRGVAVSCYFRDGTSWGAKHIGRYEFFAQGDIYRVLARLLARAPSKQIRILAVWSYKLAPTLYTQESLLDSEVKKEQLTRALDTIADRWGDFVVTPARMARMEQRVLDRIAFGGGRTLRKTS